MPYKDKEKQRDFQRKWTNERRAAWVKENGPCPCGATEDLTVSRKDMNSGDNAHVWTYSEGLRKKALERFEVLCKKCAKERRSEWFKDKFLGRKGVWSALNHSDVWAIRGRLLGKETVREIARAYQINHKNVLDIQKGQIWSWLTPGRRKVAGIRIEEVERRK